MTPRKGERRLQPAWWTVIWVVGFSSVIVLAGGLFTGAFHRYDTVTLTSDRAGLVMDTGGKVKLRGVEIGRVAEIAPGRNAVTLQLQIDPAEMKFIPSNVEARIQTTTAFGAKFVDLVVPEHPSSQPLLAGQVLRATSVSPEANTIFQNITDLLKQVDPGKLNAVLSALAEGVRGKGTQIGDAIDSANDVLLALNPRMDTVREDFRAAKNFADAYGAAAQNIIDVLDAASTTSTTISHNAVTLDSLLVSIIDVSNSGMNLIGPNQANFIDAINLLNPTTNLLKYYNPVLTCTLVGAKVHLDNGGYQSAGGNGYSAVLDAGITFGKNPYRYPDNLPTVGAKGGPGGKPSCGSLPDVAKQYPVRQLVTDTGWGTGLDIRPNPGIASPCYADWLPVTRAVPQPPKIRQCLPGPAIGPVPYPGAPPYGAALYGPDGTPLYPGVPPAPPATAVPADALPGEASSPAGVPPADAPPPTDDPVPPPTSSEEGAR
jgi:phospholipid/cholesterol/gamma-HCH transport system substrate-binding protein